MITVKLVNLFRRAGAGFQLKTPYREVICDMQINPSTAHHEATVPLEVFLKHSKEIAKMAQTAGVGVYVADITLDIPAAVQEFWAGYNIAMDGGIVPDDASKAACAGNIVGLEHGHEIKEPALPIVEPRAELREAITKEFTAAEIENAGTVIDSLTDADAARLADSMANQHNERPIFNGDLTETQTALSKLPSDEELREKGYRELRTIAKPFNVYRLGMTHEQLLSALIALRTPAAS